MTALGADRLAVVSLRDIEYKGEPQEELPAYYQCPKCLCFSPRGAAQYLVAEIPATGFEGLKRRE